MRLPTTPSPPAYWHVPEGSVFTIADEVIDFMPEIGYDVDEPERLAVRALLPQKPDGTWMGLQSCIVAPRQNIKTATMISLATYDTFVDGLEVVWTAHEFKTSADAFKDFQAIIEGHDDLASEVLRMRTSNGAEGYDLRNGGSLRIVARSGRSGRGFSKVPRLYLDEALYVDAKMMGAITPTMAAIPNAHLVMGSSPCIPSSEVLREVRDRGRAGQDRELGYVEWTSDRKPCASADCRHKPETPGCALDDEYLWWQGNPALQRRIAVSFLRSQRKVLAAAIPEFMREHMGWHEDPAAMGGDTSAIPPESWAERLDAGAMVPPGARVAFGVARSWDRQRTWVGSAALLPDGRQLVQLVPWDEHLGLGASVVDWLSSRLATWHPVAIGGQGGNSPESSLLEDAQRRPELEPLVRVLSGIDVGQACGNFYDAATKGTLAHIGQEQLDAAVEQAQVRAIGDSWVWDLKGSPVDVAGLKAVTVALHLLNTTTADQAPSIW